MDLLGPLGLFWGFFFSCLYLEWSSKVLLAASIVLLVQLRKATIALLEVKRKIIDDYLWILLSLVTFIVWCVLCDSIELMIDSVAKARLNRLKRCKPVMKWKVSATF